jgi:phosphatidylinositol alpha-1,6-mannosyltransferase
LKLLALVSDAFGGHGGIARYNRDLLSALVADGRTRIVVLPRGGHADPAIAPSGLQQRKSRGRLAFVAGALWAAWHDGPFDAVFCGHLHLAPVAALVAGVYRLPLWLQLHGVEAWKPLSRLQRGAAERASLVTAVSRYTRHRFLGLVRIEPWRLRVLPNTVGARFAPGAKSAAVLDRHRLHGKTVLLTVGRLDATEQGKGHDRVIQALAQLVATRPDIVYVIVGDGTDRDRLAALARTEGVGDRVVFTGAVPDDELPDYYRTADLFVLPSVQEGFGIVLLEAASSGLPTVAARAGGSIDALADGALGRLVDPDSQAELVEAIDEMLNAPPPDAALLRRYGPVSFGERAAMLLRELTGADKQTPEDLSPDEARRRCQSVV